MAKIYWKVSGTTLYLRNNSASGYSAWTESEGAHPPWNTDTNQNTIVTINIQNSITPTYFLSWFTGFAELQTITNWSNLKLTNITDMSHCFDGCSSLNQLITIPDHIESLLGCFMNCTSFNQPIVIPNSVTDISSCFYNCTSFNQPIEIPNSVIYMQYCFSGCTNFNQSIVIPNSVSKMYGCFLNCSSLEHVVAFNNPTETRYIFYNTTQNIDITVISDSLNSAEYNTWSSVVQEYNNVYFTSDITTYDLNFTIGDYEYTNFNEYVIGEDTTPYIKIQVKNTQQTTYGPITAPYINNILYNLSMSYCFYNCASFNQSIVIPNGVTDMSYCFRNCTSFNQSITIPNGVIDMEYCFYNCTSFNQSIVIPNSVTDMFYCFGSCTSFNQSIVIPNGVTNMSFCFSGCTSFNQLIVIPNSVTRMQSCFVGCTSFNQLITIPNSVTNMINCFSSCTSFNQPITISNSITNMSSCFRGCTNFNQPITIPNSVTDMQSCFKNCTNFNQPITIPNGVTSMSNCFENCTNFNQPITIPDSVTSISYCFTECISLNNIITINNLTLLTQHYYYTGCFYNTTQKIILCCDYRINSAMKDTLNAIAGTANNHNVQVGELSITVIANRDNINTTDANVQVTITRFRGNNEVINAIDIYKDDSSTPETVTWSPSDMRMDTAVKTFTTTISNVNEAKTVQLKVIARDDFSDSAPQYATVATNFYTMDVLAGGKEISFGMKAVQDDLYESIQDETVPTFETNKFYERVVNSETGYNSYILLETEPDDWGTNWTDYYILAHEDGLFKCAMDAQFNNDVSVGGNLEVANTNITEDATIGGNVTFNSPSNVFVVDNDWTYSGNITASSGAEFSATITVTKDGGYYPIAIADFHKKNSSSGSGVSNACLGSFWIDTHAIGSAIVKIYGNAAGGAITKINYGVRILWVKCE